MQTQIINSESNEKLKIFKSLLTAKGIKENKKFILCGRKLIHEFFEHDLARFKPFAFIFDNEEWPAFIQKNASIEKYVIPKIIFKELDVIGTADPLLILEYKDFDTKDFTSEPLGLELISPLGDPRNLGALIRSAVGFGVHEIILTKESAHPFLPQSVKASAGSILYANLKKSELSILDIPVVENNFALALEGKNISTIYWPKNLRLWVGEEGPGLKLSSEQKNRLHFITIPTLRIESLNAMVSASLALWEWKKSSNSGE